MDYRTVAPNPVTNSQPATPHIRLISAGNDKQLPTAGYIIKRDGKYPFHGGSRREGKPSAIVSEYPPRLFAKMKRDFKNEGKILVETKNRPGIYAIYDTNKKAWANEFVAINTESNSIVRHVPGTLNEENFADLRNGYIGTRMRERAEKTGKKIMEFSVTNPKEFWTAAEKFWAENDMHEYAVLHAAIMRPDSNVVEHRYIVVINPRLGMKFGGASPGTDYFVFENRLKID